MESLAIRAELEALVTERDAINHAVGAGIVTLDRAANQLMDIAARLTDIAIKATKKAME